MNVERDEERYRYRLSSPDRRVWCEVDQDVYDAHSYLMPQIERVLLEARMHGVNGLVLIIVHQHHPGYPNSALNWESPHGPIGYTCTYERPMPYEP